MFLGVGGDSKKFSAKKSICLGIINEVAAKVAMNGVSN